MRLRINREIVPSAWTADLKRFCDLPVRLRQSREDTRKQKLRQHRHNESFHSYFESPGRTIRRKVQTRQQTAICRAQALERRCNTSRER